MRKNKKYLIAIVVAVLILSSFMLSRRGVSNSNLDSQYNSVVSSVNAVEFAALAKDDDSFLLDVHIPEQTHIPGTDAFIPYNEISQNINKLPQDKNTQILVYCRSGSMSKEAVLELQNLGYTNVVELAGGINEYKEANVTVGIAPTSQDLGTVVYGDVAKTEFTLTNFTPAKLAIARVSTSCGCTSAEVAKKSLEPYESTIVSVSFDPAFHKDDTDIGQLTRTIYIDTDNPNFKQVTASITANVIRKAGE